MRAVRRSIGWSELFVLRCLFHSIVYLCSGMERSIFPFAAASAAAVALVS